MTDRFLRACRRQPVDHTPVWFMRQAGRYMADYRALRERHSLLELCRTPELATRITLQPVDAIDVDAAIIFSDLLLPFEPMGLASTSSRAKAPASSTRSAPKPTSNGSGCSTRVKASATSWRPLR
jgi:uroporphyrinogen decarboxylase